MRNDVLLRLRNYTEELWVRVYIESQTWNLLSTLGIEGTAAYVAIRTWRNILQGISNGMASNNGIASASTILRN